MTNSIVRTPLSLIKRCAPHPGLHLPITSLWQNSRKQHPKGKCCHLSTSSQPDKLRIAIVGGGAAGMSTALHLAPLVTAGLIQPVDIYEPHPGENHRDIGVGIWSTAWWPFLQSISTEITGKKKRESHVALLKGLEECGSYVADVGYRSPDGSWLVRSELNAHPCGVDDVLAGIKPKHSDDPALLFVRERDLISCLWNSVQMEMNIGTMSVHSGAGVDAIDSIAAGMGSLVCSKAGNDDYVATTTTSEQYHLIIAADGMNSTLRSRYAGHHSTNATPMGASHLYAINRKKSRPSESYVNWERSTGHRLSTEQEDRGYIVFRGNAPKLKEGDMNGSFQTWGEEKSMRFAAVPFRHVSHNLEANEDYSKLFTEKKDEEVWFATINDELINETCLNANTTAEERKRLLLEAFNSWHEPVRTLIETTRADDILYEMAVAHRFSANPVHDINAIIESGAGPGPTLVFVGDSMMTVDPVLAQGFTIAMESGATLARSLERVIKDQQNVSPPPHHLEYQLFCLRQEINEWHFRIEQRLLNLLRSTEVVQRLAQPHGVFGSFCTAKIIRPVMKLCPEGVKKAVFDYMMRYSLGLSSQSTSSKDER